MTPPKLTVVPDESIPTEVLASSIRAISQGMKKLRQGPLNDRALLLLITDATPSVGHGKYLSKREVKKVLDGIESLEAQFLRKKK